MKFLLVDAPGLPFLIDSLSTELSSRREKGVAGALAPAAPRTHKQVAVSFLRYLKDSGFIPILVNDGAAGAAYALAKAGTHEERLAVRQRDLRKGWATSVGGAAAGAPNGLSLEHSAVYSDLLAACTEESVPLLATGNEADATLAYIGARRRRQGSAGVGALPVLYMFGNDGDLLLVPGAVVVPEKRLKAAFLDDVTGGKALSVFGILTDGLARRLGEMAYSLLVSACGVKAEAKAAVTAAGPHLVKLAAITNNDFVDPRALSAAESDELEAEPEGPVARHWRDFMAGLPSPTLPLWRAAAEECPLVVGIAWFAKLTMDTQQATVTATAARASLAAADGVPALDPLSVLQHLLATDARAGYAFLHLSGGLVPLEIEANAFAAAAAARRSLLQVGSIAGAASAALDGAALWAHEQLNAGTLATAVGVLPAAATASSSPAEDPAAFPLPVRLRAAEALTRMAALSDEPPRVSKLVDGIDRCRVQPVVVGSAEPSSEALVAAITSSLLGYYVASPDLVRVACGLGGAAGEAPPAASEQVDAAALTVLAGVAGTLVQPQLLVLTGRALAVPLEARLAVPALVWKPPTSTGASVQPPSVAQASRAAMIPPKAVAASAAGGGAKKATTAAAGKPWIAGSSAAAAVAVAADSDPPFRPSCLLDVVLQSGIPTRVRAAHALAVTSTLSARGIGPVRGAPLEIIRAAGAGDEGTAAAPAAAAVVMGVRYVDLSRFMPPPDRPLHLLDALVVTVRHHLAYAIDLCERVACGATGPFTPPLVHSGLVVAGTAAAAVPAEDRGVHPAAYLPSPLELRAAVLAVVFARGITVANAEALVKGGPLGGTVVRLAPPTASTDGTAGPSPDPSLSLATRAVGDSGSAALTPAAAAYSGPKPAAGAPCVGTALQRPSVRELGVWGLFEDVLRRVLDAWEALDVVCSQDDTIEVDMDAAMLEALALGTGGTPAAPAPRSQRVAAELTRLGKARGAAAMALAERAKGEGLGWRPRARVLAQQTPFTVAMRAVVPGETLLDPPMRGAGCGCCAEGDALTAPKQLARGARYPYPPPTAASLPPALAHRLCLEVARAAGSPPPSPAAVNDAEKVADMVMLAAYGTFTLDERKAAYISAVQKSVSDNGGRVYYALPAPPPPHAHPLTRAEFPVDGLHRPWQSYSCGHCSDELVRGEAVWLCTRAAGCRGTELCDHCGVAERAAAAAAAPVSAAGVETKSGPPVAAAAVTDGAVAGIIADLADLALDRLGPVSSASVAAAPLDPSHHQLLLSTQVQAGMALAGAFQADQRRSRETTQLDAVGYSHCEADFSAVQLLLETTMKANTRFPAARSVTALA